MNISPTFNSIHPTGVAQCFANMTSEQTYYIAHNSAVFDKQTNKRNKTSLRLLKLVPLIDTMVYATPKTVTNQLPDLSSITEKFAKRLGSWTVLLGGFALLSKGLDTITNKSPKLKSMEEKHPLAKSALDIGLLLGGYKAGQKGVEAISKKIPDDITAKLMGNMRKLHKNIDESKFAKNIYEPIASKAKNFLGTHPELSKTVKKISPYIVPAVMFATVAKVFVLDPLLFNKKVNQNYQSLKTTQNNLKDKLEQSE